MRRVLKPVVEHSTQAQEEFDASVKTQRFIISSDHHPKIQTCVKWVLSVLLFLVAANLRINHHQKFAKRYHFFLGSNEKTSVHSSTTRHFNNSKCDQYRGILHIEHGDSYGAAGTIFFLFIMNQLLYADKYQLLPWIHLNNISQHVYDDKVHGGDGSSNHMYSKNGASGTMISSSPWIRHFQVWRGPQVSWSHYFDEQMNRTFAYPGPPQYLNNQTHWEMQDLSITGNGVWESYFQQPLFQDFAMPLLDCPQLPVLSMTFHQATKSLHDICPWSVRAWKYRELPPRVSPEPNQTIHQWLEPQRIRAHAMVSKYYHFQPAMLQLVDELWDNMTKTLPTATLSTVNNSNHNYNDDPYCLGMHVRHSDKANLRRRIPTDRFKRFVDAYRKAGGTCVYLATDSDNVVSQIRNQWPVELSSMITTPSSFLRSANRTAVFVLGRHDHHRTNTELLVDIIALSKCQFLLHGYSAVSEASMYLNLRLHNQSVNLEERSHTPRDEFENMVRRVLKERDVSQRNAQ